MQDCPPTANCNTPWAWGRDSALDPLLYKGLPAKATNVREFAVSTSFACSTLFTNMDKRHERLLEELLQQPGNRELPLQSW